MSLTPGKADFWDRSYGAGEMPWDLGQPSPAFRRLLASSRLPKGKLIVLGAGRGHDARMFAEAGFEVTAVDFSALAVQAMRDLQENAQPHEVLQADIFRLPDSMDGQFDYVLEYTCYCAIEPGRRSDYYDVVARLLKAGGVYVALAFPLGDYEGGPPFAVSAAEMIRRMTSRGFSLEARLTPQESPPGRQGREELLLLEKLSNHR